MPDSSTALISYRSASAENFKLVDLEKNTTVWDVPAPEGDPASRLPVKGDSIIHGGYLLLCEPASTGYTLVALDLATGQRAGTWSSIPLRGDTSAQFFLVAGKLYLVTNNLFSPLLLEDIPAKRNGWQ